MHKVLYRAGGIWAALIPVPVIAGAYESNYVLEWMRIPFVEALLAAVIFVSILAEIKTAGFSGGGLIAVIAGGLLLGSGWYGGNVAWFEFLLYFGGIALILLDIFIFVSGFGVAAGILSMTAGLYFTFGGDMTALWVLSASMILAIIGIYFLADHLSENRMWKKLSLTLSLSSSKGYVSSVQNLKKYEGKEGNAATVLRPSGKVEVEGTVVDAVSEGGFILQGAAVRVVRAEGNHLVVK